MTQFTDYSSFTSNQDAIALSKGLSRDEEKALIIAAQKGNKSAADKLVKSLLFYVISIANRFYAKSLDKEDLIISGCIGLSKAIQKFNTNSGLKLITYARNWIEKEIRDEIYNCDSMIYIPQNVQAEKRHYNEFLNGLPETMSDLEKEQYALAYSGLSAKRINNLKEAASCNESLDSYLSSDEDSETRLSTIKDSASPSAEEEYLKSELGSRLDTFLNRLTPREATVIKARAGFGYEAPLSLGEIGDLLGISKSAVRDIEKRVQVKARRPENAVLFEGYQAA